MPDRAPSGRPDRSWPRRGRHPACRKLARRSSSPFQCRYSLTYLPYLSESPSGNPASPTFANQSLSVEISLNPDDVSGEDLRFDPLRAVRYGLGQRQVEDRDGLAIVAAPARAPVGVA